MLPQDFDEKFEREKSVGGENWKIKYSMLEMLQTFSHSITKNNTLRRFNLCVNKKKYFFSIR